MNYSDLEYHLILRNGLETVLDTKGTAILSPGFIMAAESYDDEVSGGAYDVYGYSSHTNECEVSFVLGESMS